MMMMSNNTNSFGAIYIISGATLLLFFAGLDFCIHFWQRDVSWPRHHLSIASAILQCLYRQRSFRVQLSSWGQDLWSVYYCRFTMTTMRIWTQETTFMPILNSVYERQTWYSLWFWFPLSILHFSGCCCAMVASTAASLNLFVFPMHQIRAPEAAAFKEAPLQEE